MDLLQIYKSLILLEKKSPDLELGRQIARVLELIKDKVGRPGDDDQVVVEDDVDTESEMESEIDIEMEQSVAAEPEPQGKTMPPQTKGTPFFTDT